MGAASAAARKPSFRDIVRLSKLERCDRSSARRSMAWSVFGPLAFPGVGLDVFERLGVVLVVIEVLVFLVVDVGVLKCIQIVDLLAHRIRLRHR